jgi:hypothetical protein
VNGLPKTPKLSKKILLHGLAIVVALVVGQLLLDVFQRSILLYMPPIGFALFLLCAYGVQPMIVGVLNIVIVHRFYNSQGWQIGLWLNGFFLVLVFSIINLIILTVTGVPFSPLIGILEIFLLSYPFGYLARFSNRSIPRLTHEQTCPPVHKE